MASVLRALSDEECAEFGELVMSLSAAVQAAKEG
jgi:hypothetical protein